MVKKGRDSPEKLFFSKYLKVVKTNDVMIPKIQKYYLKSKQDKVYNGPQDIFFNEN